MDKLYCDGHVELISSTACSIGGYLIDAIQLEAWLNSRIWPPHNPKWFVERVSTLIREAYEKKPENEEYWLEDVLVQLQKITCYGYYIPDTPFACWPTDGHPTLRFWHWEGYVDVNTSWKSYRTMISFGNPMRLAQSSTCYPIESIR